MAGLKRPGPGWASVGFSLLGSRLQAEIWKGLQEGATPLGGQRRGQQLPRGLSIYFTWGRTLVLCMAVVGTVD